MLRVKVVCGLAVLILVGNAIAATAAEPGTSQGGMATCTGYPDPTTGVFHPFASTSNAEHRAPSSGFRVSGPARPEARMPDADSMTLISGDPRDEYGGSAVKLQNGDLLCAYDLWTHPSVPYAGWKMIRRSTDDGATWSAPDSVVRGGYKAWPSLRQARDGTIWMLYDDYRGPNLDTYLISYVRSTDNGQHWSGEYQVPTDTMVKERACFFQPADDRIWVFYDVWQGSSKLFDIFYQTSTDGGQTWLGEQTLVSGAGYQMMGSMNYDSTGKLWAFYYEELSTSPTTWCIFDMTSTDTGATWSSPQRIVHGDGGIPHASIDASGKIWLAYDFSPPPFANDIYYVTSTDGGASWSDTTRITRFAGVDYPTDLMILNGRPKLFFESDRAAGCDIYCGPLDHITDPNPPPYLPPSDSIWTNPHANPVTPRLHQQFAAVALCKDETSVASAQLVYTVDGVPQPDLTLYDDGNHGDYQAGDGRYGNFLGPYDLDHDPVLTVQVRIRDGDGNVVLAPAIPVVAEIPGIHDTSNLQLYINPADGRDGAGGPNNTLSGYPSCQWPRLTGSNYLYEGHAWVGKVIGPDTLVSGINPNNGTTDWTRCAGDTMFWYSGLSDLDSRIRVDDRAPYSGQSIGIEIHKHGLSWHRVAYGDFIIEEYAFVNTGRHGNLDSTFIGFCYDFDVSGTSDKAACDTSRNLTYERAASGSPPGYIGIRMLSQRPRSLAWWTLDTDPYGRGAMYRYLVSDSAMNPATSPADYRLFQSAGPYDIAAGDSVKIVIGIAIGTGLGGLQACADEMDTLYEHGYLQGVAEEPARPNPAGAALSVVGANPMRAYAQICYHVPSAGPVALRVYDTKGGLVRTIVNAPQPSGDYRLSWNRCDDQGRHMPAGVYVLRLELDACRTVLSRKFVLIE